MIVEAFLILVLGPLQPILNLLPSVPVDTFTEVEGLRLFMDWVRLAAYFFPFGTLFKIAGTILSIYIFRIAISFIKNLWAMLPVV